MQAAEIYREIESQPELGVCEEHSRKLQDVLSRSLPSFKRTAFRYLSNTADAEDAVQDALLAAHIHLNQFRGNAQMSTWVGAIVANCARMQLRKRARAIHLSLDEPHGEEQEYSLQEVLADDAPTPEDECQQSELHARLLHFLAQLSPSMRAAFQLRELDGLTTSEAAEFLGVAEGTLKAQLARARAKLTKLMRRALDHKRRGLTYAALPSTLKQ